VTPGDNGQHGGGRRGGNAARTRPEVRMKKLTEIKKIRKIKQPNEGE